MPQGLRVRVPPRPPMKQFYTWQQFDDDIKELIRRIQSKALAKDGFDGVWGPPRGGLTPAVVLSHALNIPLLLKPTSKTLIVDDIADTGKTLDQFKDKNFIVTLFYHRQSMVVPNIWLREKTEKWVVFPWETGD